MPDFVLFLGSTWNIIGKSRFFHDMFYVEHSVYAIFMFHVELFCEIPYAELDLYFISCYNDDIRIFIAKTQKSRKAGEILAKIIAFANQKGGVGKTTSAINIASALGIAGKCTLLIDLDPQGNASSGVGVRKSTAKQTVYDLLIGRCQADDVIMKTEYKNLSVIPSGMDLAAAELELADMENRHNRLREPIQKIVDDYDYIIIDCPPSLGMMTINALSAANGVVVPMQCEYFSLEGLSQIMMTVKQVKKHYNPTLSLTGILITMYNGRLNLSIQVLEELKKHYADKLFSTNITRSVRLSEAPSYGAPIHYYDKYAKGAEDYSKIAAEIMERI